MFVTPFYNCNYNPIIQPSETRKQSLFLKIFSKIFSKIVAMNAAVVVE